MKPFIETKAVEQLIEKLICDAEISRSEIADILENLLRERELRRRADREAGQYVESVICLRTRFTGEPPYTGWKGLGLALNEALDERDRLIQAEAKRISKIENSSWLAENDAEREEPFAVTLETDPGTALPRDLSRFSKFSQEERSGVREDAPTTLHKLSSAELIADN